MNTYCLDTGELVVSFYDVQEMLQDVYESLNNPYDQESLKRVIELEGFEVIV